MSHVTIEQQDGSGRDKHRHLAAQACIPHIQARSLLQPKDGTAGLELPGPLAPLPGWDRNPSAAPGRCTWAASSAR